MCLNCGCGEYWDKRGKATNLTMEEVEQAAKGEGASVEDAAKEIINGLNQAMKRLKSRRK